MTTLILIVIGLGSFPRTVAVTNYSVLSHAECQRQKKLLEADSDSDIHIKVICEP